MKLVRYGQPGEERPGLIDGYGQLRDLSGEVDDIAGDTLSDAQLTRLRGLDPSALPPVEGEPRLGPCVGRVGKFLCIGLNYVDHCEETGKAVPEEPVLFMKATSALCGPDDGILTPRGSQKLDWEVELGVVIGKEARYVSEDEAESYIAGYCVAHDVSEREFQIERGGQWDKGKGCDTFGPLGPWLVTRDDIPDPLALGLWLEVNDQRMQDSSTANMVFGPRQLVAYLSRFMSLQPGDIISTGTPPGVGMGQTPPRYLRPDDRVRLGIEGLGEQRQTVLPPSE